LSVQILSIPLLGGMNQTASTVIGEPRILRAERCRMLEAGKLTVSPGYYRSALLSNMRAAHQCGDTLVVVSSSSGHLYTTEITHDGNARSHDLEWKLPAFEPPIRVDMPGGLRTFTTAAWSAPTLSTTPTVWFTLVVLYNNTTHIEYATLNIFNGTSLVQTYNLAAAATKFWRVATDYATSTGWLVLLDTDAQRVTLYNVSPGATPATEYTHYSTTCPGVRDVAMWTNVSTPTLWLALLGTDGYAYILSSGGSTTMTVDYSVGEPASEIAIYLNMLLRTTAVGHVRTYLLSDGSANSSELLLESNGSGKCALGKMPKSGSVYLTATLEVTNATTGQTDCSCYLVQMATGTISKSQLGNSAKSTFLLGAPLRLETSIAYQLLSNNAAVSRSAILREAPDGLSAWSATYAAVAAQGEVPMRTQVSQGGGTWASATPTIISIRDSLCGETKRAYVVTFPRVVGGVLTGTSCDLGVSAIVCAVDSTAMATSTKCIIGYDCLDTIDIDHGSVAFLGAHPWIDGDDQTATGFLVDGPVPVVSPNDAASGTSIFTDGDIYQYCVRAEFRDSSGTLYRSAPTQPLSYTIVANANPSYTQHLSHSVSIGWIAEAPAMPGHVLRLYRTTANGTIFYDTGKVAQASVVAGMPTFTDNVSDATIVSNPVLSEGAAVTGGLKAKYGIPPCRFGWRGKDRLIVGGLELPKRVRWSQTIFPGEAPCFPHASELGWTMDFPDDINGVACLDDAWIIFSRSRIWSVFGLGPEDNGTNGSFESPRILSPDRGLLSWKSIAECSDGLYFQSTDAQIYLIRRGQLTVEQVSFPVQDELRTGMVGNVLKNPIVSTLVHTTQQTVHFVRAPLPASADSPPIVFDRRFNHWSTDGDGHSEGLMGAIGAVLLNDVFSSPITGCETLALMTPTYLTIENATGATISPIYGTWTARVETNDISPFGIAGWGKMSRIGLVGYSSANTSYALSTWRDRNQATADDTATLTLSDSGGADFPFLSRAPAQDKCSAIRVRVEWSDRATYPAAIVLRIEPSADAQRTASTRST
jgi:hypothetical protein